MHYNTDINIHPYFLSNIALFHDHKYFDDIDNSVLNTDLNDFLSY